jgi:hypothetical protein
MKALSAGATDNKASGIIQSAVRREIDSQLISKLRKRDEREAGANDADWLTVAVITQLSCSLTARLTVHIDSFSMFSILYHVISLEG